MKTTLLILSTEAVAEVLHDEHALQTKNDIHLDSAGSASILMWRGKVGKPEHAAECQLWRDIADKFTEHLTGRMRASGVNEVNMDMADELIIQGNLAQERGFKIEALEKRLAEVQAELERKRQAENDLIRDRDRLIHKDLAEARAAVQRLLKERDALAQERDLACQRAQKIEERIINLREAIRLL